MNSFKNSHPCFVFIYFAAFTVLSMLLLHPVCAFICFACGIVNVLFVSGKRALRFVLTCVLPVAVGAALLNPLFNHEGQTILHYFPGGNPLTAESVFYGIGTGLSLGGIMCGFYLLNAVMTSDMLMYITGNISPSIALFISMALHFVPLLSDRFRAVRSARNTLRPKKRGIISSVCDTVRTFCAVVGWSMEHAVETADSMKSRGYGVSKRTFFSNYTACRADFLNTAYVFFLIAFIALKRKALYFSYFPAVKSTPFSLWGVLCATAYALFCLMPALINIEGAIRWKILKSKI